MGCHLAAFVYVNQRPIAAAAPVFLRRQEPARGPAGPNGRLLSRPAKALR